MEVLLLKDVPKLGSAGDAVRVADGYARNYLIPRQLAKPMDEGAKREAEIIRQARERKVQREVERATALAEQLNNVTITILARAGEQGKLYGSVTAADIAEKLAQVQGLEELDRRKIMLKEPIRELGRHSVEIRLSQQAVAHVNVIVEEAEQES